MRVTILVKRKNRLERDDYFEKLGAISRERKKVLQYFKSQNLDALAYPLQKRAPLYLTEPTQAERSGIFASATTA